MSKMLFAILSFILAIGIFFFFTKPSYTGPGTPERPSVNEMNVQIAQYDDALQKVAQLDEVKKRLLARYNSFNPDDIKRLETLLPDHVDNIGLILELDNIATRYGMTLENVNVGNTPEGENQGVLGDQTIGEAQKYGSITLQFSTFGTYDKFKTFLKDLEASLRIVDLEALKFSASEVVSVSGEPTYSFDITLRTYWLK